MKKSARNRRRISGSSTLMITPMIDMFTVILIFLIVSYAPEQSKIMLSEQIEVPKTSFKLTSVPQLQIEVTDHYLMVNGERLSGLNPSTSSLQDWSLLSQRLQALKIKEKGALVMSDKSTNFAHVDRAVAHLAKSGFSEVYFLTENDERQSSQRTQ